MMTLTISFLILAFAIRWLIAPISFRRPQSRIKSLIQRTRRSKRLDYNSALINFLLALRGEISAGLPTEIAFRHAMEFQPAEFLPTVRLAEKDSERITDALARCAHEQIASEVNKLRAVILMSQASGAPLIPSLDELIAVCLARSEQQALIDAELSSTKATIVVLALLPAIGLGLSTMMGINSFRWLTTTSSGWICICMAVVLEGVGILWTRMLIRQVLKP